MQQNYCKIVLRLPEPLNQTLADSKNFSTFLNALRTTELDSTFNNYKNVTIFIPTDKVFSRAIKDQDNSTITEILKGLIVANSPMVGYFGNLTDGLKMKTLSGKEIIIKNMSGTVYAEKARITVPDILLSNGVAHITDTIVGTDISDTSDTGDSNSLTANLLFSHIFTSLTILFFIFFN